MENVLVSACLLGVSCRYDGKSKGDSSIIKLADKYNLIPVCPEIYGGLPTPRTPSERVGEHVMMSDGTDVTQNYQRGADETLRLCRVFDIKIAVLKLRSPSCGKGQIYDGSFSGSLVDRDGVTAELLMKNGIHVIGEDEIETIL